MARLSLALPILERCERPSEASVRAERLQPGRLAQGPDEKCGTIGRTAGLALVIIYLPMSHFSADGLREVTRRRQVRGQRTEDRGQRTEGRRRRVEDIGWTARK